MEIIAWCEKQSTCSGHWTSLPIGDSRWNNFGSCGNWMEPEGRNSGNTFMNFRNGQHPNISNKGFIIVQLLFPELLFSWHLGWFLLLNIHLSMYFRIDILGLFRILDASELFNKTGNDYRIKDWTMKFDDKIQEN